MSALALLVTLASGLMPLAMGLAVLRTLGPHLQVIRRVVALPTTPIAKISRADVEIEGSLGAEPAPVLDRQGAPCVWVEILVTSWVLKKTVSKNGPHHDAYTQIERRTAELVQVTDATGICTIDLTGAVIQGQGTSSLASPRATYLEQHPEHAHLVHESAELVSFSEETLRVGEHVLVSAENVVTRTIEPQGYRDAGKALVELQSGPTTRMLVVRGKQGALLARAALPALYLGLLALACLLMSAVALWITFALR